MDSPSSTKAPLVSSLKSEKLVIINCVDTRYHVVRTAAVTLGWVLEDGERDDVPHMFHSVSLLPRRPSSLVPYPSTYSSTGTPQVLWLDRSVTRARVAALHPHQRLNHFCGIQCIARKAVLFKRLMRIHKSAVAQGRAGLVEVLSQFAPRSFSSSSDYSSLVSYSESSAVKEKGTFFIIKPNKGCQGRGIRLSRTPADALSAEDCTKDGECLVQEYIDRPLLIEAKKFDLRLYVLLVSVTNGLGDEDAALGPLRGVRLYIHQRGLVRMCADSYMPPTDRNCDEASVHLTNYAVNKKAPGFSIAPCGEDKGISETSVSGAAVFTGNKRDLAFMEQYVESLPELAHFPPAQRWPLVRRRVDECVTLTVLSGIEVLRRELEGAGAARGDKLDGRGCFELLGFDVMLREGSLDPVLMEVNHSPSLFCESDFDFSVKHQVLKDTFSLLDTHIVDVSHCTQGKKYAAYMRSHIGRADRAERDLVRGECSSSDGGAGRHSGYAELLPHYTQPGCDNWDMKERERQVDMLTLGKSIL